MEYVIPERKQMKTGLILEGGAMRGMFTAGVLDVFMENGLKFDGMIGVSAGACFGCNYKSEQIGRSLRYNLKYCKDPRYCGFRSLLKTGDLYGKDFCYYEIPQKLDVFDTEAFIENPMEFHVVCTDTHTGKAVYHRIDTLNDDQIEWIRASASMPMVSRPVEINGRSLLDGGIADSIPLRYFEHIGYNRNVVILTQPKNYVKKQSRGIGLIKRTLKEMPHIADALEARPEMYNKTLRYIDKKEAAGEIFVIRPPRKLEVGHIEHNREKLFRTYQVGRSTGKYYLKNVKAFLQK